MVREIFCAASLSAHCPLFFSWGMVLVDEYLDRAYEEAFQSAYDSLTLRKETDREFTKEYLAGLLQSLYVQQGSCGLDRSEAKAVPLNATVAVCEILLNEWE